MKIPGNEVASGQERLVGNNRREPLYQGKPQNGVLCHHFNLSPISRIQATL